MFVTQVSVITVVMNHVIGLKNTHESLLNQIFLDWEMIIVVGDSSDGTLSLAKILQAEDPRVRLIEQSGKGIYEAMNEGLGLAVGNYTWFMNAGDKFASESTLLRAVNEIAKREVGLLIGGHQLEGSQQNFSARCRQGNVTPISFAFNRGGGCHQAMIFRTMILEEIGGFNVSYSLASDFDLAIKVIKKSRAIRIFEIYAEIEPGGIADRNIFQVHQQKHQIRRRLLGGWLICTASVMWTFLARAKIVIRNVLS
jgi:putative colanic acid biosynthesis glycosyltransferase